MVALFTYKAEGHLSEYGLRLSWLIVQEKAKLFAQELNEREMMSDEDYANFKASRGYLDALKRRKDLKVIKLHGEANTIVEEAYQEIAEQFRNTLRAKMIEHNVSKEHVFNGDQTGLYFKRFPCTTICSKDRIDHVKGTKAMKSKDRITTMVCSSSGGVKCPLAFVGKTKNPRCFADVERPSHYTSNSKAWFNTEITQWWFQTCFDPFFRRVFTEQNENLHCIVVLDGCSAHGDIQERLDQNGMSYIHVLTLPPNVTSRLQPMDQGVISWLKKRYKYKLISDLMKILSNEQNLAVAVASRRGGGRDGVAQGSCPHVYDAIQRVNAEWNSIS